MNIELNHIGSVGGGPAKSIELVIDGYSMGAITDRESLVDPYLIEHLELIAWALRDHNNKVKPWGSYNQ
jgi:hypothetical protein